MSACINCIETTISLVESRYQPYYQDLVNLKANHSMLHIDAISLIHELAFKGTGAIIEIGTYVGGSTIAIALGIQKQKNHRKFIAIEAGGQFEHETLPSDDVLSDLLNNLKKYGVLDYVDVINGNSRDKSTIQRLDQLLLPKSVSLLVADADGEVEKELTTKGHLLADNCVLVIDDYMSPNNYAKVKKTQEDIGKLEKAGFLKCFGIYGWGTWVGKLVRNINKQ